MTVSHTLTTADVVKIRDDLRARYPEWTPAELLRAVRTEAHAAVQLQNPVACSALTPEMKAQRDRREPLTLAEQGSHYAHQLSQVTAEQAQAYQQAIARGDRNARQCKDAHHHAQMTHQTEMWAASDKIVAEAGVA
jgi:hypothetical protein